VIGYNYENKGDIKMSNMSYCRFQNTLEDLKDCKEHINDTRDMSDDEKRARNRLVNVCRMIVEDYYNKDNH